MSSRKEITLYGTSRIVGIQLPDHNDNKYCIINCSLCDMRGSNQTKAQLMLNLISLSNLCIQTKILLTKGTLPLLQIETICQALLLLTSVFQRHNLVSSQPNLPAWHKATNNSILANRNITERNTNELLQSELKDTCSKSIEKCIHAYQE